MASSGATAGGRVEIVFVDTRVDGYETIVASVRPGAEVVLIDAGRDGLAQMAAEVAGRADIDAIHVVGHGAGGVVQLGSAVLSSDTLHAYAGDLGVIGRALAPDGDIQLWGCQVGADAEGQVFIQALAEATGADIAASDDLTGAGGDWILEVTTGDVAASTALDVAKLAAFQGNLAAVSGNITVPANGSYGEGDTLTFTVTFDENVTVTGSDSVLGLTIGSTAREATFASSSGASITYTYTVQPGDTDANGIAIGAINLNTSTVKDGASNDVNLSVGGHVPATNGILVDTTAPAVASVDVPGNATYVSGQTLSFTVNFDENVTVAGTDSTLALTIGATARTATYASKTANSITYTYTVQANDNDADGIAVSGISLNGGTIRDAAGNNANLSLSGHVPSTVEVLVDGGPPSVSGNVTVPANGSYGEGATLTFTVNFEEDVTVTGSDAVLGLTIGSTPREATFAASSGNSVTFTYTVQPGETDANGIAIGALNLNTSTIKDVAGNDVVLALGGHVPVTSGILVDTTAPAVASVSVPTNGTYRAGQNLDFTVTFDENVTVTGSDSTLALTVGSTSRSAALLSSTGATVTYRYTVQAGETDADGITVGSLSLGASTIRDATGNNADVTLNSVGATNGVLVDATVPSVTGNITVPTNDTYVMGETLSFTATFSEDVTVTGSDSTLGLTIGAASRTAAYASKTANSITYTYTVQAGDNDADGIAVGAISLGTTTIEDAAGNDASLSLSGHVPATTGVLVDTTAPSFTSATVNGASLVMTYADAGLLDAAHAPATGAFTVMAGGNPVSVTAVTVNGAAHTITLTLASAVTAGTAVTVAYSDPTGGNDANAIQDVGGNDAASLSATSVANNTPTPTPTHPPTSTMVDGVPVQTRTSPAPDGSVNQVVTIPVVQPGRVEQVGNNTVADIPLVKDAAGQALLALQVPVGYGLQASGAAQPKPAGNSLTDLIREIKAHTAAGSQDENQLTGAGTGFLSDLDTSTPLLVQTIVTTGANTAPAAQPLTISGQPQAQGQPQTALVIDGRSTPGIHIELQNVEFAAVIGTMSVSGGDGQQHVWGDGAAQTIFLGADSDVLHGGGGDDTVGSAGGNDAVYGDDGDDVVFGGEEADLVQGNAGNDTARGDAGDDRVYGGRGDDQVFGGGDNDQLFGDLGQDTLQGNAGRDTLDGGEGADLLRGGQDADVLFGGASADLLFGDNGDDSLQGNVGQDTLDGGEGADRLHGGQDADVLFGGAGADLLFGDNGDDSLQGNVGQDTLQGGAGDDQLHGGRDNDVLFGGEGKDRLSGDQGDDVLTGGADGDLFVSFAGGGADRVTDFNAMEGDRVGLLAGTVYTVAQVGADTVVTLTGGGKITLANVQLSSLAEGWIVTV